MIERHIKGGQKTIAYKQLGLSMDIETKVVQHVSSPKESDLTTLHTYSIFENIVFLVFNLNLIQHFGKNKNNRNLGISDIVKHVLLYVPLLPETARKKANLVTALQKNTNKLWWLYDIVNFWVHGWLTFLFQIKM